MKVEQINTANYRANSAANRKPVSSPQFTGSLGSVEEMIVKNLPQQKIIKAMKSLEWLNGEVGGIILTALGTGLVAPIFIGANPFVKAPKGATEEQKQEVKNTKWYTALRQPISAALAVIFQVGAQKPIDNFLDTIFNKKANSCKVSLHMDQCDLNTKTYIKTLTKKAMKDEGIKKPSLLKGFTEGFSNIKQQRKSYDDTFTARVKATEESQFNKLAENFQKTGKIKIGDRNLDNKTLAELVNKQIDEYIEDAKTLKIDDKGLTFYSKRAKTLIDNENHIREIFKNIPQDEKQLEGYLKGLLAKEKDFGMKKIIQEILNNPADMRKSRISRTLERINNIKSMCANGEYSPQKYLSAMSAKNAELDRITVELRLNKIANPEKATEATITNSIKKTAASCKFKESNRFLNSILHDTDTFNTDGNKLISKIYKDVTKSYKKLVANKYKSFNQISKIMIGVFITLPITCTALNWIYPRFMELFFPKLSGTKKGGKE